MGARGPAPKAQNQRRRRNLTDAQERLSNAQQGVRLPATQPDADEGWHPVAARWFESLGRSGQSWFYQESDWALAAVIAEAVSRELKPQPVVTKDGVEMLVLPMKGATLSAFLKGCTQLLVSESDRRRAAVELQAPQVAEGDGSDGSVLSMAEWVARTAENG